MKVDINLLPPEHRPKRWALPLTVGLIIVVLAGGYYGFGLYGKSASAYGELEQLESQLDSVNAEIEKVLSAPAMQEYQERITEAQTEIDRLQAMQQDYETRNAERIYWKPVLQTLRELAPTDVILNAFEQNGDEITVDGELSSDVENAIVVVEYAQLLENRGIFSRIAFEIGTEKSSAGEGDEPEEIIIFTMLLEVKPGG